MRPPLPTPWTGQYDHSIPLLFAVAAAFIASAATTLMVPSLFWLPLGAVAVAGIGVLAYRHTVAFCVAWLLIAGATLEMTLADILGLGWYQPVIAAVKAAEIVLVALCMVRYGAYPDVFNPGLAFMAMFAIGLVHGLHPNLTAAESVRSLAGSMAPFAFGFCRLPAAWAQAMVRTTIWIPLVSVTGGAMLSLAGMRDVVVDSGGLRLAGLGHPAFLAGFCLAAIYACLIELYREGRSRWMILLAVNFVILVLSGARAPIAYGVAVIGLTLAFVPSATFPRRCRILLLLLAVSLLPVLLVLAGYLTEFRLFNLLSGGAGNMSGRELLWPPFERAAAESPWVGWGVGAGNVIIPPDSELARAIRSWAAHNEYLRMSVEGGQIGRGLLVVMFVLWIAWHMRRLCRTDRAIMRLAFLAFAAHAYTDNVLISTSACVFFAFAIAVFARGRLMDTAEVA